MDLAEDKDVFDACFPFLKPACSWSCSLSTAVVIWQKTLLVMDSSVMPLHLLRQTDSISLGVR